MVAKSSRSSVVTVFCGPEQNNESVKTFKYVSVVGEELTIYNFCLIQIGFKSDSFFVNAVSEQCQLSRKEKS